MAGMQVGVPDKMTVFQKCVSSFSRSNVTAEDARQLLTQLVHLFGVGETFAEAEATQLFFTITRLFQKESAGLKQMVYLAIKDLVPLTENVIMGTSVLMRDVQYVPQGSASQPGGPMDPKLYRAQALRALCRILDTGAVEGMDRLMRSALVSSDPSYASAGLVSAYNLLGIARDTVKRWSTETQDAMQSNRGISQYHALGLLREVRAHDSMALRKLVISLAESRTLADLHAEALHARMTGELLSSISGNTSTSAVEQQMPLLKILHQYMSQNFTAVALEAAKATLNAFPDISNLAPPQIALVQLAISVLRDQLVTPSAPARFAGIRALNRYALVNPQIVGEQCNDAIEALVTDNNKSIATYAITALLKTGSESNVDGLVTRISAMLKDIADDFRLVVVDAVRSLAKRYPAKHDQMLDFFADTLEHHGHAELKIAIVEAIGDILQSADTGSESLHNALMMLCETIEDSEYPQVTVRVLHLLGAAGPSAPNPATYVRFIYNRVILENAVVRAAAVSALAKFGESVAGAKALVENSKWDANDEVRDRASVAFVAEVSDLPSAKLAVDDLEAKLVNYLAQSEFNQVFDANTVKVVTDEERAAERVVAEASSVDAQDIPAPTAASTTRDSANSAASADVLGSLSIPEFESLGAVQSSGDVQTLTDEDMEYIVRARAHVFPEHLVLQYQVTNNYELHLENVKVQTQPDATLEEIVQPEFEISAPALSPGETATVYSVFTRTGPAIGAVESALQFVTDGDDEEYPIDELALRPADYIKPVQSWPNFDSLWQELESGEEAKATQALSKCGTLREAASFLESQLGCRLLSDLPEATATKAALQFAGNYGSVPVLVQVQIVHSARQGVVAKALARSEDADIAWAVVDGLTN